MRGKIYRNLSSVVFFILILFVAFPVIAKEPLKNMQLYARGIASDDAEAAPDDAVSKNVQQKTPETKPQDSPKNLQQAAEEIKKDDKPLTLQQEVEALKREMQKMRNEAEARKRLEVPEEEKSKSVEDILSAAGRQYTLLKKGTVGLSYSFGYSYYSGDAINESTYVEPRSNHNITNVIDPEYAILNNLTVSASIPFIYKYNKVGTSAAQETTDLGDIGIGFQFQPFKAGGSFPTTILSLAMQIPTGSSPYEISRGDELSTGSGHYAISGGISLSKVIDPLVAFGSLSLSYNLPQSGLDQLWYEETGDPRKNTYLTKVEPGAGLGLSLGFGYALSYQASLNLGVSFSYNYGSKYTIRDTNYNTEVKETGTYLSSSFNVGTGWRITPSRSVYLSLGIGLTVNDPDVSFSMRVPFEF